MDARLPLIVVLAFSASACTSINSMIDKQNVRLMGAEELETSYTIDSKTISIETIDPKDSQLGTEFLAAAAKDSLIKCNRFLARLSASQTGIDTTLDIISLAASGTAAIATLPTTTISALAAGATFATGTRATIDSDVYGKAAAPLLYSTIHDNYVPQYNKFMSGLDVPTNNVHQGYAEISGIHDQCKLEVAIKLLSSQISSTPKVALIFAAGLDNNQKYRLISGDTVLINKIAVAPGVIQLWTISWPDNSLAQMTTAVLVATLNAQQAVLTK